MTIANWILLGLIIVTYGLLVLSYIRGLMILKKICACLILPLCAALIILGLTQSLPDSYHIIVITISAFSFITLSGIFLAFEQIRTLRLAGRITSIANLLCWCVLYEPIFRIHSVSVWLWIICSCVYIAVIITACIFSGKQKPLFYCLFTASFAIVAFLHFCGLIFLCYERTIASILLFTGTTLSLILMAFHFIDQAKLNFKHAGAIRFNLLIASQILIACSNILMIS